MFSKCDYDNGFSGRGAVDKYTGCNFKKEKRFLIKLRTKRHERG